jgi:hypothetical protein
MEYMFLTDNWWNWFLHEYAFTMLIIAGLLKVLAMADEGTSTNDIVDYIIRIFKR